MDDLARLICGGTAVREAIVKLHAEATKRKLASESEYRAYGSCLRCGDTARHKRCLRPKDD